MKYPFMDDIDFSIISELQVDLNISWLVTLYSFEYNGDFASSLSPRLQLLLQFISLYEIYFEKHKWDN